MKWHQKWLIHCNHIIMIESFARCVIASKWYVIARNCWQCINLFLFQTTCKSCNRLVPKQSIFAHRSVFHGADVISELRPHFIRLIFKRHQQLQVSLEKVQAYDLIPSIGLREAGQLLVLDVSYRMYLCYIYLNNATTEYTFRQSLSTLRIFWPKDFNEQTHSNAKCFHCVKTGNGTTWSFLLQASTR